MFPAWGKTTVYTEIVATQTLPRCLRPCERPVVQRPPMASNPIPPLALREFLDFLREQSQQLTHCLECGSVFEHLIATFLLYGETWDIALPVCANCDCRSSTHTAVAQKAAA